MLHAGGVSRVAVPARGLSMRAVAFAAMLLCLAAACTESRSSLDVGSRCDLADGGVAACPEGSFCGLASRTTSERTCRTVCDGGPGGFRCSSGEACHTVSGDIPSDTDPATCWPGGELVEDAPCTVEADRCGHGLYCFQTYGDTGDTSTCRPVCNTNADCRVPGERCVVGMTCGVPCDPAEPSSCPVGAVCLVNVCESAAGAATCAIETVEACPLGQFCFGGGPISGCYTPVQFADLLCAPGRCDGVCTARPCGSGG